MNDLDAIHILAELLEGAGARPVVAQNRPAPSTIYDLHYRLAVNACAFEIHARIDPSGTKRLAASRLKLLQFVAIRPWLLPVVREWSASENEPQFRLAVSQRLRRGFLGDVTHDGIIEFLAAREIVAQTSSHLISGKNVHVLENLHSAVVRQKIFSNECAALDELLKVKITNSMLEGW